MERGGKQQFLHCQAVLRVRMNPSKMEALKVEIKQMVGWTRGDGSGTYIQLKEFGAAQVRFRSLAQTSAFFDSTDFGRECVLLLAGTLR